MVYKPSVLIYLNHTFIVDMDVMRIFFYFVQVVCAWGVVAKERLLNFENQDGIASNFNITIFVHVAENETAKHFKDDTFKIVQCTTGLIKLLRCHVMSPADHSQNEEFCRMLHCQCSMDCKTNTFSKCVNSLHTCMVYCCVELDNASISFKVSASDEVFIIRICSGICENIDHSKWNFDALPNNNLSYGIQNCTTRIDKIYDHYRISQETYTLQIEMEIFVPNSLTLIKHVNCQTADDKNNLTGILNIYVSTNADKEMKVFHENSSDEYNSSRSFSGERKDECNINTNDLICPVGYKRQLSTCVLKHNYMENTSYPALVGDGRSVYEIDVIVEKITPEKISVNTNMMYDICSRLKRTLTFFQHITSTFQVLNIASPIQVEDNYKTYCTKILLKKEITLFFIVVYLQSFVRMEAFRFNSVKVSLQNFNDLSEIHCKEDLTLIQLHGSVIQNKHLYSLIHIDNLGQTFHLAKQRYKISTTTRYEKRLELISYCAATFRRLSLNCSLKSYNPGTYVADNSTVLLIKENKRLSNSDDFDIIDGVLYICRDSTERVTTTEIQVTGTSMDGLSSERPSFDDSVVHDEGRGNLQCPAGYKISDETCILKYNGTNDKLSRALDKEGQDVHEVDILFHIRNSTEYKENAIEEFCNQILWSLKHSFRKLFQVKTDRSTIDACREKSDCICATLKILTKTNTSLILKYIQVPIQFFSRYSFIHVSLQNFDNVSQLHCNNDFSLVLSNTSVLKQVHNELLADIDSSGKEILLIEQRYRLFIPHQGEARLYLIAYCLSFERLTIHCPMESHSPGYYTLGNETIVLANNRTFNISQSHDIINGVLYICKTTHFVFNETHNETQRNNDVLIITSVCSLAVSFISLLTILFIHFAFQELRNLHGKVLMCLVSSLLLAQTLELLNAFVIFNYPIICKISAVVLHFAWISGFAWNAVLTFDLARRFNVCSRSSFKHGTNHDACQFLKYCIFGWFIPLIFVAILNALQMGNVVGFLQYGHSCWISDRNITIYVSMLPIAVMLVIAMVCLLITFVGILKSRKITLFAAKMKPNRIRCITYSMATVLLSITCLFGFLATFTNVETFDYVLGIFSGTPGLIMLLGILVNIKNIRNTQIERKVKTSCKYIDK